MHPAGQVGDAAALALGLGLTDPAVAVVVGDGQCAQSQLQADHLEQAGTEHVWRVASAAGILGDGRARAGVAIGRVVAGGAGIGRAATGHLGGAVGQRRPGQLAGLAVNAVAHTKLALENAATPLVTQPRVDLL